MSYGYSLRLRSLNEQANASNIGVRLGRMCIKHDVPVAFVAKRMGVTRATVYNWFCGVTTPQDHTASRIEAYLAELT